ncbi:hypothetical protein Tco_1000765 [Tanacetum coccineum]
MVHLISLNNTPSSTPLSIHHNIYSLSSSIPQLEYPPSVDQQFEFSQQELGLIVPVFQKGDDHIDAINHMMSFLTAVVTSSYPTTNNQLRNSSNPRQQAIINNGRVTLQPIQRRQTSVAAEHAEFDESNANVLERFYTSAGNPVKEILLKLNLPDHRSILTDSKMVVKLKYMFQDFCYSDTERLSRSDEVLKLKNFKKDATLKLSKSTNQEWYEHVDPEVTS